MQWRRRYPIASAGMPPLQISRGNNGITQRLSARRLAWHASCTRGARHLRLERPYDRALPCSGGSSRLRAVPGMAVVAFLAGSKIDPVWRCSQFRRLQPLCSRRRSLAGMHSCCVPACCISSMAGGFAGWLLPRPLHYINCSH